MPSPDDQPSSFDALAHEHNLSDRLRDLCRLFWKRALKIGEERGRMLERRSQAPQHYRPSLHKDTAPGEFR